MAGWRCVWVALALGMAWGCTVAGHAAASRDAAADSQGTSAGHGAVDDAPAGDDPVAASDAEPTARPALPTGLVVYVTGNAGDAAVTTTGPALLLMGGGTDVDAAFARWLAYAPGGDVAILRTSGEDGYNPYLYADIGGVDSVETLLVTSVALANDPYVAWTLAHAEAIFLAGGDQSTYLRSWRGTAVETGIEQAWQRGALVGGTSAGLAVLSEFVFAAYAGSATSEEALVDPYAPTVTLERDFLAIPPLAGTLADTHFSARDRMGRLVAFMARVLADGWASDVLGLGVDAETALVAGPDGLATVVGAGHVYVVHSAGPPAVCRPGAPLEYAGLKVQTLSGGQTVTLPGGASEAPAADLSAGGGALTPSYPY